MKPSIPFNKFYKLFNLVSLILISLSLILLIFKGLNFGIDFKGGTLIELRTLDKNVTITELRKSFNQLIFYCVYLLLLHVILLLKMKCQMILAR